MSDQEIHAAMAAAFGEMPEVNLDGTNPHFKSRYATLGNIVHKIRPVLAAHGLYFIQRVEQGESGQGVRTIIGHKSGGQIDAGFTVVSARKDDAHGQGSALTYAKRYGLCAAFGIVDEQDDDGNAAAAGSSQNGHGRPVARQASAGAADFLKVVINETKMDQADAKALCGDICKKLGINKANATPDDWARCIATVKDKGDDVFAWISEGA